MTESYDMRAVAPTVCKVLGVRPPRRAEIGPLTEVVETMGVQRRLVVVVLDAFGASTWAVARIETPTINALANRHLVHIRSVMPTVTPVNFATMLTGVGSKVHLIKNREEKLNLETVFDVLRERGRESATAARSESSLGILISPHADHARLARSNRDEEVKDLAAEAIKGGVDLLWVQLLDVDDAGHQHGPLSSRGVSAAGQADFHLKEIATAAFREGYAIMVLADHGQHTTTKDDGSVGGTHGTDTDEDVYVPFIWCTVREIGDALGLVNNGASVI